MQLGILEGSGAGGVVIIPFNGLTLGGEAITLTGQVITLDI